MHHDSIPIAMPDQPTQLVVVEQINEETLRVVFNEQPVADTSDGVPSPIEAERSSTVAVVLIDMEEPLELVAQMARRDGIPMYVTTLPGLRGPGQVGVINATIQRWRAFQRWFPLALIEAEQHLMKRFDYRKASALMFRLRTIANEIQNKQPPNRLDVMVLRLEQ